MRRHRNRSTAILLCTAICAGTLSACTKPVAAEATLQIAHMVSPSGQREILLLPATPARRLVLFMHGVNADEKQLITDQSLQPLRDSLLEDGYAIAASESRDNNIGDPASVADQAALLHDAAERVGHVDVVDLLAFSMGGLDALLAASEHIIPKLRAVALISPVTDQLPFLDAYRADAERAFGSTTDPTALTRLIEASDPERRPATSYRGYRYAFWHSSDDAVVPRYQSVSMIAYLRSAGISAWLYPLNGNHGVLLELRPPDVLTLFGEG